ncbi:MAG: 3-oxoacyl-[acyl-carrier protein] reductase [Candidatus Omnitrophota bacterium]|jgi:3-oxoacyl-[acyl-carrier protein] reductase
MSNAIIFGASGGVGSALAGQMARKDWHLLLASRNEGALVDLAQETGADYVVADATVPEQVETAFDAMPATWSGVDGVVNCIGNLMLKPAHLTSLEDWRETIRVNLDSSFNVIKTAVQRMPDGGNIVLLSSAAASVGMANHEAISAAKAGVEGLVRAAAATYAAKKIRINAVAPGLLETTLTSFITVNDGARIKSEAMHALGRMGQAGEVARVIAWMLDPQNAWMTGQVIAVDGGLSTVISRS